MKYILALLLVALSSFARAEESCVPYLECKPLAVKAVKGTLGTHLFWFVRNKDTGSIDHHGFSCEKDKCDLQQFIKTANEVLIGLKTPAAAWGESMTFGCDYNQWQPFAGQQPMCAERKEALLTFKDEWLEGLKRQLLWKVKPLTGSSTRPLYRITDGVRGTTVVGRVSVGETCNPGHPSIVSGDDRFMRVLKFSALPFVTLCALEAE